MCVPVSVHRYRYIYMNWWYIWSWCNYNFMQFSCYQLHPCDCKLFLFNYYVFFFCQMICHFPKLDPAIFDLRNYCFTKIFRVSKGTLTLKIQKKVPCDEDGSHSVFSLALDLCWTILFFLWLLFFDLFLFFPWLWILIFQHISLTLFLVCFKYLIIYLTLRT